MARQLSNQKNKLNEDVIEEEFREDSLNTSDSDLSGTLRINNTSPRRIKGDMIDEEQYQGLSTGRMKRQIEPQNDDVDISQLKDEARSFLQR